MSIAAKHAYRFNFLKSEKWQDIRIQALVARGTKCEVCGEDNFFNDAHHVKYPDKWADTDPEKDLRILCRPCHERIHSITTKDDMKAGLGPRIFRELRRGHNHEQMAKARLEHGVCYGCRYQREELHEHDVMGRIEALCGKCNRMFLDWKEKGRLEGHPDRPHALYIWAKASRKILRKKA